MNISKRQRARLKNKRFWVCAPWFILISMCLIPFHALSKLSGYAMSMFEVLYIFFDDLGALIGYKIFRTDKIVKWVEKGDKK